MTTANGEYVQAGSFVFSTIFGLLSSVTLAAAMNPKETPSVEGRLDMDTFIVPADELPSSGVLLQGSTKADMTYALNLMDSVTDPGDKIELSIVSTEIPTETDLANFVINAAHAGIEVSFPTLEMVDGMPTTTCVITKGEPGEPNVTSVFPLAALIGILPVALITGVIGFGIFKIEDVTKALMPILLITFGGLIILVGLLSRKHVTEAAGKFAESKYRAQNYLRQTFLPASRRPTRDEVEIGTWKERDRLGIWVTDKPSGKTIAEWWDENANQMFEDGFFKPGVPERSYEQPSAEFIESVLSYLEDIGVLQKGEYEYEGEKYLPFAGMEGNELVWKGTFPDQVIRVTVRNFFDKPKTVLENSFIHSKAIVHNIVTDHELPLAATDNEGKVWWLATINNQTVEVVVVDIENLDENALTDIFNSSVAVIEKLENVQLAKTMKSTWQARCQPQTEKLPPEWTFAEGKPEPILEVGPGQLPPTNLPQTQKGELGWKDFYKGNRIQACIDSYNHRIENRGISEEKQAELHESLKTDWADLVKYQDLQAFGFASGLITQEEATQLYQMYGSENPTEEHWDQLTLAEKITGTKMADELLAVRIKKTLMPQTEEYEEVEMFCQECGKKIPSPSSFRTPEHLRVYFVTGKCQECQDKAETKDRSIIEGLEKSMNEEQEAADTYLGRMKTAREAGDDETAQLYEHVISEEVEHKKEFSDRKEELNLKYFSDSPEYLSQTIDRSGWRDKLDKEFQAAIARSRK
jgi:rubrerythrin